MIPGSPPHTWRKHKEYFEIAKQRRITSTYVEKTIEEMNEFIKNEDHLHIRGENASKLIIRVAGSGSPPHTWRKLFLGLAHST